MYTGSALGGPATGNIIECPELLDRDHGTQRLALHRTPQQSHHVPESIAQTLLEPGQVWGRDHCPGEPVNGLDSASRNVAKNSFGVLSVTFKEFCLKHRYILQYNLLVNKTDLERSVVRAQHVRP